MVTQQLLVVRECRSVNLYGAKQIIENVFNYFYREPAADITAVIQQTVQAAGVGLTTIYKIRRKAKSAEGLFTFLKKK